MNLNEGVYMQNVSYEEFKKLDLRVVKVIKAENIPGKTRIMKLIMEISPGVTRSIIAGGAEYYEPSHYLGRKFIALVNLEPKRIAGVQSQGMLLAAECDDKPIWLIPEADAPLGSKVR